MLPATLSSPASPDERSLTLHLQTGMGINLAHPSCTSLLSLAHPSCLLHIPLVSCTSLLPLAHPSCSYYYLLSPSILFLHILLFCAFYSIAHFTLISLFFTIYMLLCYYFYIIVIFILLHCPLSGPDFTYISLLIIPCIIFYVTNKETLNLEIIFSFLMRSLF